jgi:hypothetical protein
MADNLSPANEAVQTNPTPTPSSSNPDQTARTSPLVGILVLLATLVFIVWKSRGLKEPKVTASCCAPVIDEKKKHDPSGLKKTRVPAGAVLRLEFCSRWF